MEPILIVGNIATSIISSILYEFAKGSFPIVNGKYSKKFQKARENAIKTIKERCDENEFKKAFFASHYLDVLLSFEKKDKENLLSLLKDGKLLVNDDQHIERLVVQAETYWRPPQEKFNREVAKNIIKEFFNNFKDELKLYPELFSYIADCEQKARHEILKDQHTLISIKLDQLLALHIPDTGEEIPELMEIPEEYNKWVIDRSEDIDYRLLLEGQKIPKIELPEIFIPLYANSPEKERPLIEKEKLAKQEEQQGINLEKLAAENDYLVIEGQAGSGKTTLIKHLAHSIIKENNPYNFKGYLPVLIFLKDLQVPPQVCEPQ